LDISEYRTLALTIHDLDQTLMEINVVMLLFPIRGAYIFARVKLSVKSTGI